MNERNGVVRVSRLLVDGFLVTATESYANSVLSIVGSSEGIRDRLKDKRDEQHEDDEPNEEVDVEKYDDNDDGSMIEQDPEEKTDDEATEGDKDEEDITISDE